MTLRNLFAPKKPGITASQRELGEALFPGIDLESALMMTELADPKTLVFIEKVVLVANKRIAILAGKVSFPSSRLHDFAVPCFFRAILREDGGINVTNCESLEEAYQYLKHQEGSLKIYAPDVGDQAMEWHIKAAVQSLQKFIEEQQESS